ncbi:MAG: methionyl-tRNA formyltransferase [Gammaproteobacteria bacterium]|nr:methionyl-tRNA formyltransferase [Gammaproteobacteria bacterium]
MNLVFAGTPDFAVPPLKALVEAGHLVRAVYAQPDRPAGRGRRVGESAVKQAARELGLPLRQPERLDAVATDELRALSPDALIVVAYGQLLSPAVLALPHLGCINVHASLLPRWRGAAPIARAIEAGDTVTGVSVMQMEAGLDTGPVWASADTAITDTDTASTLHDRLSVLGARLLVDTLARLMRGDIAAQTQDDTRACYAKKLRKDEAVIDWSQPAAVLHRRIRAFLPQPVACTTFRGKRLRLWGVEALEPTPTTSVPGTVIAADLDMVRVATGAGALALTRLQLESGKILSAREFANGQRLRVGERLGETAPDVYG